MGHQAFSPVLSHIIPLVVAAAAKPVLLALADLPGALIAPEGLAGRPKSVPALSVALSPIRRSALGSRCDLFEPPLPVDSIDKHVDSARRSSGGRVDLDGLVAFVPLRAIQDIQRLGD